MDIKKVVHYAEDDPEFISDYYSVELFVDGKKVKHFSDWYHGKGDIKCDAFIEGIKFMHDGEINYELEEIADGLTK